MTAEIAVLNKSAVALAADSLVTVGFNGENKKTYHANKLFPLSSSQPVGVMVYGAAELLGVPWESVVSEYRAQRGGRSFATIQEYANDLFRFIETSTLLFPKAHQDAFARATISGLFNAIRMLADKKVKEAEGKQSPLPTSQIAAIHSKEISAFRDRVLKSPKPAGVRANFGSRAVSEYATHIAEAKKSVFNQNKIPLSAAASHVLTQCVKEAFEHGCFPWSSAGVVVAGFGTSELYPHVWTCDVLSVVLKKALYRPLPNKSFPPPGKLAGPLGNSAAVIPFAQTDVVETVVEGMSRRFRDSLYLRIAKERLETAIIVLDSAATIGGLSAQKIKQIEKHVRETLEKQQDELRNDFQEQVSTQIRALVEVIDVLPKSELADVATALVELTSLKRKMSLELETVGGPIDAAVISKNDGFVWISRKRYFDPSINHR